MEKLILPLLILLLAGMSCNKTDITPLKIEPGDIGKDEIVVPCAVDSNVVNGLTYGKLGYYGYYVDHEYGAVTSGGFNEIHIFFKEKPTVSKKYVLHDYYDSFGAANTVRIRFNSCHSLTTADTLYVIAEGSKMSASFCNVVTDCSIKFKGKLMFN